jgi:hypothetical protein
MKKLCLILGLAGLLAITCGFQAEAEKQPVPPPATGSPKPQGKKIYDPAKVVVVSGRVTEVKRHVSQELNERFVVLLVQNPERVFRVLLGPADYVDQQSVKIVAGDQVEVKGFRVTTRRILPIQLRKGNQVMRLRGADGHPLWRKK